MHSATEVFFHFLKLGLTAFGGPVAHIAFFQREFVDKRGWLSDAQFAQLLTLCQFLPGPASSQLGFAIGLLRAGWLGAVLAFIAFTLPSVILLLLFASALPLLAGNTGLAIVHGLKLVACIIVADAVIQMAQRLCPDWQRRAWALAVMLLLIVAGSGWLQIALIALGGVFGLMFYRGLNTSASILFNVSYSQRHGLLLLTLFFLLLLGLPWLASSQASPLSVAEAFYRSGSLVFGGGHVVLPLLDQAVVSNGWVSQQDFLAGYGAAQAIPGPLFSFSAYLGSVINSDYSPWLMASVALLATFLPGFLLIAGCLPLWQRIATLPAASAVVTGINASVVGVLAAVLYDPIITTGATAMADAIIIIIGLLALRLWTIPPILIVVASVAASIVLSP